MTLRAKCISTSRAGLDGCHVLLNLSGHHLLLQARRQRFSFCYSQSHGGRGDFLRPLDGPQLVFDGAAMDRLKYQLDFPFHPQRIIQPTTLHTLYLDTRFWHSLGRLRWSIHAWGRELLSILLPMVSVPCNETNCHTVLDLLPTRTVRALQN